MATQGCIQRLMVFLVGLTDDPFHRPHVRPNLLREIHAAGSGKGYREAMKKWSNSKSASEFWEIDPHAAPDNRHRELPEGPHRDDGGIR